MCSWSQWHTPWTQRNTTATSCGISCTNLCVSLPVQRKWTFLWILVKDKQFFLVLYPELLRQHRKIMLQNRHHLQCRWHQQQRQWWRLHRQRLVHVAFFQTQRRAADVDLRPTRTCKGTEHKLQVWEDGPAGSSGLAVHMYQLAFGHIPRTICLKRLSLLSYNKAFFLGELLRNLDFATAVMSSQANWHFHSSIQLRSLSKWWVSPVKSFVLAVLQIDQAARKSFESFFSVTPAIVTARGKSDYTSKDSDASFNLVWVLVFTLVSSGLPY